MDSEATNRNTVSRIGAWSLGAWVIAATLNSLALAQFQQPDFVAQATPANLVSAPAAALSREAPTQVPTQEFRPGRVIAIVGRDNILAGDVLAQIEPRISEQGDKIPESEKPRLRESLMRKFLADYITTKCLAQRFMRDMVGNKSAKEVEEAQKKVRPKITQSFYGKVVPKLMKDHQANSELELEQKLRDQGTSLTALLKQFSDGALASEAVHSNVPKEPPILLQDLREYYEAHADQWNRPARARWRQISAHFAKQGSREATSAALAAMGNDVFLRGTPFEAVARKSSDDFSANKGGVYDWTTKDALRSKAIDQVVFSIPPGHLSKPIEDDMGFHIVEVLEREAARTIPFEDVQLEIREILIEKRREELRNEFIAKVKKESLVWSLWPEDFPGARPLVEAVPDAGTGGMP
jgi:hypothetical protein